MIELCQWIKIFLPIPGLRQPTYPHNLHPAISSEYPEKNGRYGDGSAFADQGSPLI
jgi:hypothetical protein